MSWALRLPLIVLLLGMSGVAMLMPAFHAYAIRDLDVARIFLYSAIIVLILFSMFAFATSATVVRRQGRSHLISLFAFFAVLPAILALPFAEAVPNTTFFNAYVEMVSSITTTGMTLFDAERLPDSLHLWRAQVAWMGGFFVWVTAIAILAPLHLGGFEVIAATEVGAAGRSSSGQMDRTADASTRLVKFSIRLAPIYVGLTVVL